MIRRLLFILVLLCPALAFADGSSGIHHPPLEINNNGSLSWAYIYLLTIASGATFSNNGDGTLSVSCGGAPTTYLLLEDGTNLLLEDGTHALTE